MSLGRAQPRPIPAPARLAVPQPYPVRHAKTRVHPRDREVAREALLATTALVFAVLAVVTAIGISGWMAS